MNPEILDIGYQAPKKKKILVVDDELALQSLIADSLSDEFQIFSALDGRAGAHKAEENQPDLILMDIMMPDLTGNEAVKILGANSATKSIPVIFITAKDFNLSTVAYLKNEPNVIGFLPKPFHIRELREVVRNALQRKS